MIIACPSTSTTHPIVWRRDRGEKKVKHFFKQIFGLLGVFVCLCLFMFVYVCHTQYGAAHQRREHQEKKSGKIAGKSKKNIECVRTSTDNLNKKTTLQNKTSDKLNCAHEIFCVDFCHFFNSHLVS
jgi:hypothetical protein